jgi:SAM-dependent methyltransferase
LDAGCGTGQVSLPLAARGYDVRGIDISKEMTMLAQAKVRSTWKADYSVADVRSIPAEENSFDAAVVSKLFPARSGLAGSVPITNPRRAAGMLYRPDQRTRRIRQCGPALLLPKGR